MTPTISLPGWEDIISIPHGTPPTRDQYREYQNAKRQGRTPNLTPEVISEVERRVRIRDRIRSSPTPETAKRWGKIMTWLDDTQDLFSILSITGRLAARAAPKLMGRLIPGLGWVLLASDILKLLTILSSILQPFFVSLCHGWRKGIAAGLPLLVMGNAAKLLGHGVTGLNPFSRAARLRRLAKFSGKLFRVGELLELAQAAKSLTGYGLTLGALVGVVAETGYAIEMFLRGQPVEVALPGRSQIHLKLKDGTTYRAGSPKQVHNIYDAIARGHPNPDARLTAQAKAEQIRRLMGQ